MRILLTSILLCFTVLLTKAATYSHPTSGSSSSTISATSGAPDTYYDNGGSGSNYSDNITASTYTFTPNTGSNYIRVKIVSLSLGSGDQINIYNGGTTSDRQIGSVTSANNGNTFFWVSTASDGEITFEFTSDGSTNSSGWEFQVYEATSRGQEWTGSSSTDYNTAGNWEGSLLPVAQTSVYIPDVANDPDISSDLSVFDFRLASSATFSRTGGNPRAYGDVVLDGTLSIGAQYFYLDGGSSGNPASVGGSGDLTSIYFYLANAQSCYYQLSSNITVIHFQINSANTSEFSLNGFTMRVTGSYSGSLNIPSGQTFTAGSSTLEIGSAEAIIDDTSFDQGTGTVYYYRDLASTDVEAITYHNLTIGGGSSVTKTLTGTTTVSGNLTIEASTTLDTDAANNYAINCAGNWTNDGSFTSNTSTVTFNGTSVIDAGGTATTQDFYDVVLNGTSATISTTDMDIDNRFTITSGVFTMPAGRALTIGEDMYVSGEYQQDGGTCTIAVDMECESGCTFDMNGGTLNINDDLRRNANEYAKGTFEFSGGTIDVASNISFSSSNVTGTWEGTAIICDNVFRNIHSNWTITSGSLTLTADEDGTASLTPSSTGNNTSVPDLVINGSGDSFNACRSDNDHSCLVNGNLTITAGTLEMYDGTYNCDLDVSGNIVVGASGTFSTDGTTDADINCAGNWTNSGSYTSGNNTVTFDGTSIIDAGGTATTQDFYNVILNGTSATISNTDMDIDNRFTITAGVFTMPSSRALTVGENLSVSGEYQQDGGTCTITGDMDCESGCTFDMNDGTLNIGDDIERDASIYAQGTFEFAGGAINVVSDCFFSVSNVTGTWNGTSITVGDDFRNTHSNWTVTSGTLTLTGDQEGDVAFNPGSDGYNLSVPNLVINGAGDTFNGCKSTNNHSCVVTGNLTVTAGTVTMFDGIYNCDFDVSGNITIGASGSLSMDGGTTDGDINCEGNWSNSGTYTTGSNTVTFDGSSAQEIGGSATTTFYNFTLDNSNNVSLAVDNNIENTFTFTNGKFITQGYKLKLGTTSTNATVSGESSSNYFVAYNNGGTIGTLTQRINSNTTYDFPVGNASSYLPVSFTLNSNGGLTTAEVNCYTDDGVNSDFNSGEHSTYINREWDITQSGITTPNYDISYVYADGDIIGTEASLLPVKISSSVWYAPSGSNYRDATKLGTGSVTTGTNTLTWTGLNTFSKFSAAGNVNLALPVELLSLDAECLDNQVSLNWVTASEINNDYFLIEKALDDRFYDYLKTIEGNGTTTELSEYSYSDNTPSIGNNFYRITQYDFDGEYEIFDIISVYCKEKIVLHPTLNIIPNKTANLLTVKANYLKENSFYQVRITDISGKQLFLSESFTESGLVNDLLQLHNISSGVLIISIENEGSQLSSKVLWR